MSSQFDPTEKTVTEVEEYLKSVEDAEEVSRVGHAEKYREDGEDVRSGVTKAVDKRYAELSSSDDENSDEGDGSDSDDSDDSNSDPEVSPDEPEPNDPDATVADQVKASEGTPGDPESDEYDPYLDPAVPSSFVADVIRNEIDAGGETPTLDAVHEAVSEEK